MRRLAGSLAMIVVVAVGLSSCGGGTKKSVPTSISVNPTSLSLSFGQVGLISASVLDQGGTAIAADTPTFSSDNPGIQVSSTGLVCAGTWDTSFIVCTPATAATTGTITAKFGSVTPATVTVFVHPHIDNVVVTSDTPADLNNCVSATQTHTFKATACSAGGAANPSSNCPPSAPNDVTAQSGLVTWSDSPSNVATVDTNQQSTVTVTAAQPGQANILASVSGTTSSVAASNVFTTCPVESISVTTSNNPFTVGVGTNTTLTATVTDKSAANLASVPLTWSSSQTATMTVTSGAVTSTATPVAAGTSTMVASCTPPTCNTNLYPVYSNATVGSVTGTSATTVYVASRSSTSLFPIDATSNTVGTAITLPIEPNSMKFNRLGTLLFLGSSDRLMVVNVSASTPSVAISTAALGKVLTVSPDGNQVITATVGAVYVLNTSTGAAQTFNNIAGATNADFTPDSLKAYIATPAGVWVYSAGTTPKNLGGTANDLTVLAQGSYGLIAEANGTNVAQRATCKDQATGSFSLSNTPTLIRTLPNGAGVVVADSPSIDVEVISLATGGATPGAGCPPSIAVAAVSSAGPGFSFTANQIIVTPDSGKAFITASDANKVLAYTVPPLTDFPPSGQGSVTAITLGPGATGTTTGGVTLDGTALFVGVLGSNTVDRINTATLEDTAQITVSSDFVPDLVAVRPK